MKTKTIKRRNPIAYDLLTNGLYRPKIIKNKKKYDRKKLKNGKELIKNLSHYFFGKYDYARIYKKTILQKEGNYGGRKRRTKS